MSSPNKVIYKQYMVLVNLNQKEYDEWKKDEKTSMDEVGKTSPDDVSKKMSLDDVVYGTVKVYKDSMEAPSKQELENTFDTIDTTDSREMVREILRNGKLKGGQEKSYKNATKNAARGSAVVDTRGSNSMSGI